MTEVGLDVLFKLRGERDTSQSIVIIGVDEQSLHELGSWPFPRQIHAKLLEHLKQSKAIGFDLIFAYDGVGDELFAQSIVDSPPIVMAAATDYQGRLLLPPESLQRGVSLGHIETRLGGDGVVRRVELVKFNLPVLSLAMANLDEDVKFELLAEAPELLINFYGPEFTFLYLSYSDVVKGNYPLDFFKDRYVLVGAKALAMGDVHISPFSRKIPVPGVEIQATILNNFLEESYLRDPKRAIIGICAILLLIGTWRWPQQSEASNLALNFVGGTVVFAGALFSFHFNIYLNPLLPLFVLVVGYLLHVIVQWAALTTKMVREIKLVNEQLEHGVQTVFRGLPESFDKEAYLPGSVSLVGPGGLKKHILRIHKGVRALALQNSFIKHLLSEEAPPLVIWEKENGAVILANYRFVNLWKNLVTDDELLPDLNDFYQLVEDKSLEEESKGLLEAVQAGEKIEDYVCDICIKEQGKKVYLRVVVNEVNSTILGLEGILAGFTDVTEIRELERLKGEMMNIVSHELKLPLTTIVGFSEMLADSLTGTDRDYAREISRQSDRLARMIEDFLHIARIESGKYVINRYPFDFIAVVYDASSVVTHAALKKRIDITYNLPEKITPIWGDETLVTQVVLNLLDNAVKFSFEDSAVTVELIEQEAAIELRITDSGPGIADDEKQKVFEKFIRGDGEKKGDGFGLGLSFVQQVVENHSGNIRIEDSITGGVAFIVSFPKVTSDQ